MKRLLLFFIALLTAAPICWADEGDEEIITFPCIDAGEVVLGKIYRTTEYKGFAAVLHVDETGVLRVMSRSSDFPMPYADAAHSELMDFVSSFYEGKQGYVINVNAGDVIYFYRNFCMSTTDVWFEMLREDLTFTSMPEQGGRLVPTGRAQLELMFNMPVATDGGTMTCGDKSVSLEASSGYLYIIYEIKEIIMRWLEEGVAPGTPINVTLNNVHAYISDDIKYGSDGTLRLTYVMPAMPGRLVRTNFENRDFKSYWLEDDEDGLFRMTFTKSVNTAKPGYLNIIYGNAETGDVVSIELPGKADGKDIVFDLRGVSRTPANLLASATLYDTIMLRPGGVTDTNGDLMYSEGIGTLASWTYELPYVYLYGVPRWEVFYDNEDQEDIYELKGGDRIMLYIYNYHVVKADGVLFTFDDGTTAVVPMDRVDVEYETNGTTAALSLTVPGSRSDHSEVTVSFQNLRLLTGGAAPALAETFDWDNAVATGRGCMPPTAVQTAAPLYDLSGRRMHHSAQGLTISQGRKQVR